MGDVVAELQFLSQSENRMKALDVLSSAEPVLRNELEIQLDVSRRTVNRIVNTLTDEGYVLDTPDGLTLTPVGALVADCLDSFLRNTEIALEYRPLLQHAPEVFRDIDLDALAGAELVVASESDPFVILDRILDMRAESTVMREIAPGVEQKSIEQLSGRVRSGDDMDVEIIIPESASVAAESPAYREQHGITLDSDTIDIYVYPGPIRFAAGVVDERSAIAVMRNDQPYAMAVSDASEMRTWVMNLFERYRSASSLKTELSESR